MKSVLENKLIFMMACLCFLLLAKKATSYVEANIARAPLAGSSFGLAQTSPPKNLGNLYPVFAESVRARQHIASLGDIDRFFVPPPKDAPVKEPKQKVTVIKKPAPEPVPEASPPPKPKPVNHLKRIVKRLSLDGLVGNGAYINGKFFGKGDVLYSSRVSGQKIVVKLASVTPTGVIVRDNQKHQQLIKFKG